MYPPILLAWAWLLLSITHGLPVDRSPDDSSRSTSAQFDLDDLFKRGPGKPPKPNSSHDTHPQNSDPSTLKPFGYKAVERPAPRKVTWNVPNDPIRSTTKAWSSFLSNSNEQQDKAVEQPAPKKVTWNIVNDPTRSTASDWSRFHASNKASNSNRIEPTAVYHEQQEQNDNRHPNPPSQALYDQPKSSPVSQSSTTPANSLPPGSQPRPNPRTRTSTRPTRSKQPVNPGAPKNVVWNIVNDPTRSTASDWSRFHAYNKASNSNRIEPTAD